MILPQRRVGQLPPFAAVGLLFSRQVVTFPSVRFCLLLICVVSPLTFLSAVRFVTLLFLFRTPTRVWYRSIKLCEFTDFTNFWSNSFYSALFLYLLLSTTLPLSIRCLRHRAMRLTKQVIATEGKSEKDHNKT